MIHFFRYAALALTALGLFATTSHGQVLVDWIPGPGEPENYNIGANWVNNFVPQYSVTPAEIAQIINGGTAYLEDSLLNASGDGPAGLTMLGQSTLELRTTGVLEVAGPTLIQGANLAVQGGGQLQSEQLRIRNSFFRYTVTGDSNIAVAPVQVTHGAELSGTVVLDLEGLASFPLGQTINLIEAETVTGFYSPHVINAPTPGAGQGYRLTESSSGGRVTLGVTLQQLLVVTVDRQTGEAYINNPGSIPLEFDAIRLSSALGSLDDSQALSISGNYAVVATPHQISQLRTTPGSDTVTTGQLSLGKVYDPIAPTTFGTPFGEDLVFAYTTTGVDETIGLVEYINAPPSFNNAVLEVNQTTGVVTIFNDSAFDLEIEGYTITSQAGLLDATESPTVWNSFELQGLDGGAWDSSPASNSERLTELMNSGTSPLLAGQRRVLGSVYDIASGSEEDLSLTLLLAGGDGGNVVNGNVNFISTAVLPGDFNGDGSVDAADYTVWRNNLGAVNENALNGNGNGIGGVDADDYLLWKQQFGQMASSALAQAATSSPVPEPSTLLLTGLLGLLVCRRLVTAPR